MAMGRCADAPHTMTHREPPARRRLTSGESSRHTEHAGCAAASATTSSSCLICVHAREAAAELDRVCDYGTRARLPVLPRDVPLLEGLLGDRNGAGQGCCRCLRA
jgi:hypothetical protein